MGPGGSGSGSTCGPQPSRGRDARKAGQQQLPNERLAVSAGAVGLLRFAKHDLHVHAGGICEANCALPIGKGLLRAWHSALVKSG